MFSNIGSDANIDWATLAQQWIQRNTKAPPPPNISQNYQERNYVACDMDNHVEADMDMDDDEPPPPPPSMMPVSLGDAGIMQFPLQAPIGSIDSDPSASWSTWMNPPNPAGPQQFSKSNPTAHIPSLLKITVPNPNDPTKLEENVSESTCTTLDAAKRKVLPAWIREGLEKMEREKQKQLERQQQLKERKDEKSIGATSDLGLGTDIMVKDDVIKTLESGDSSGNEQDNEDLPYKLKSINKSKHIGNVASTTAPSSGASNDDDDAAAPALCVSKPYEQRLADLMILVRRTLTELLLEVTNDEIAQIAKETLNSSKVKASSAQVIRKSALSSITNRLGLAAYSSSGDESDSDNSAPSDNESSRNDYRRRSGATTAAEDSEEEIKAKLRARRRAFAKITEEIEECVAMNAAREEQKLRYYKQKEKLNKHSNENEDENRDIPAATSTSLFDGNGKNNARDFGETTTESKFQQSNGKKSKERSSRRGERTTRFSDNKDSKKVVAVTATYLSQLNPSASTTAIAPKVTNAMHGFQMATSNNASLTDVNTNIHNLYTPTTAAAAGINTVLSAAEAALEKAAKCKNSSNSSSRSKSRDTRDRDIRRRKRDNSRRHSSDDTDSSSTSNNSSESTSSSSTSRDSKYSRTSSYSSSRRKGSNHSSSRYHDRHEDKRRHDKRHREDYDKRSKSSHTSSSKYSRSRDRSRSRSRSRSTYSSSSSKRHHKRH